MENNLVYESKKTVKSMWNTYKIYDDRLELDSMFGKVVIPFVNIESAVVNESDLSGLFHGHLNLKNFRPAYKLDWANFAEHVVIDKNDGHVHRILFTPDDIKAFMDALNNAMKKFQNKE